MCAIVDTETLVALYEEDDQLLSDLIEIFLQETPKSMRMLNEALASGDARLAERVAHTLKGSTATLGAKTLEAIAFQVENAARADDLDTVTRLIDSLEKAAENTQKALRLEREKLTA